MADRLIIYAANNYFFYLQWEVRLEDGEIDLGAILCESAEDGLGEPPADRGNWEHWIACKTVRELEGVVIDDRGAAFETQAQAKKALQAVKFALTQDRPLPEWAKTAIAEGWKAPKGWKA